MTATSFSAGESMFNDFSEWIFDPDPHDNRLNLGRGFESLRVAPEMVTLLGGKPGSGKTALTWQWLMSAMEAEPTLRTLVANVEMPPRELLKRQLARFSGIDLTSIRERRFSDQDGDRLNAGMERLQMLSERVTFLDAPFAMSNVVSTAIETESRLIVIDYAQRFGALDDASDKRQAIDSVMDTLRLMANHGAAVIVLSSLSRSRDGRGRSTYESGSMSLASYKESGELEYGADDALLLCPRSNPDLIDLRHEKSRYGERQDLVLEFDRPHQSFSVVGTGTTDAFNSLPPEHSNAARRTSDTDPDIIARIRAAWTR